jgi:predicted nuclease of restriction endonuclease-like (RecB) superfamily
MTNSLLTSEYVAWLKELKSKIRRAQVKTALAANRELILFYWELGEDISQKLSENNWGAKVIDLLAKDLSSEFPDIRGFSRTNLYYIKKFYEFFRSFSGYDLFVPRVGGQLPWSRDILAIQIKSNLYARQGKSVTNFKETLRDINKPMGVSEFSLTEILLENLKGALPTVEEIEADFEKLKTNECP